MARSIELLLCKKEGVSLIPRTYVKKLSVVASAYNIQVGETETGRALGPTGWPVYPSHLASPRLSQKVRVGDDQGMTLEVDL